MSSSRAAARAALLLGTLGVLAVPVSIVAAQALKSLTLLRALYYSVPTAIALGLVSLLLSRRARLAAQRSVFADRSGPVRVARWLGWIALWAGVTAGIAVAVYWVFRSRH